jgi:hypothetical protein
MGMYGGTLNVVQAQQGMGPAAPLG